MSPMWDSMFRYVICYVSYLDSYLGYHIANPPCIQAEGRFTQGPVYEQGPVYHKKGPV